jgi:hypothetical protein
MHLAVLLSPEHATRSNSSHAISFLSPLLVTPQSGCHTLGYSRGERRMLDIGIRKCGFRDVVGAQESPCFCIASSVSL